MDQSKNRPKENMKILTKNKLNQLSIDGFAIARKVISVNEVNNLTLALEFLWESEGDAAGKENYAEPDTRRLAKLTDKGDLFRDIISNQLVLHACRKVIGPDIRLSMLNARDALPGAKRQQLHCDTDNFGVPDAKGFYAFTAIWMLDEFSSESGATCIIPKSHLSGKLPVDQLQEPSEYFSNEIVAEGRQGDVLLLNGHCWHAGGENRSNRQRRAILAHYLRSDYIPPPSHHRQYPTPETLVMLEPVGRELFE